MLAGVRVNWTPGGWVSPRSHLSLGVEYETACENLKDAPGSPSDFCQLWLWGRRKQRGSLRHVVYNLTCNGNNGRIVPRNKWGKTCKTQDSWLGQIAWSWSFHLTQCKKRGTSGSLGGLRAPPATPRRPHGPRRGRGLKCPRAVPSHSYWGTVTLACDTLACVLHSHIFLEVEGD